MHLMTLRERLNRPKISKIESLQRSSFVRLVKSLGLDSSSAALSVSCGDGIWDYFLLESTPVRKIIATDIVSCPVAPTEQEFLRARGTWDFVGVGTDNKLPFADNLFDFVYHQDVIEHVENPYEFLREQYRVLRKGGAILVGTPNLFRPMNLMRLMLGRLNFPIKIGENSEIGDYVHVQEFYEQQMKLLLTSVGFELVEIAPVYFGIHSPFDICLSKYPASGLARTMSHFITYVCKKPVR